MFLKNKVPPVLSKSRNPYPCLCEALGISLFVLRLSGIAPIVKTERSNHSFNCKFKISKWWSIYSSSLYVLHFGFHVFTLSIKRYCGKKGSNWYLIRNHFIHLCILHLFFQGHRKLFVLCIGRKNRGVSVLFQEFLQNSGTAVFVIGIDHRNAKSTKNN